MHEGINRPDGRHWCAPDRAEEGEILVFCQCGKVWSYESTQAMWTELVEDDVLPELPPEEPDGGIIYDEVDV